MRWALLSFVASAARDYHVEFGPNVQRARDRSLRHIRRADGRHIVDTGEARFDLSPDGLLIDQATLLDGDGETSLLRDGRAGA